jgi:hypothetical protein
MSMKTPRGELTSDEIPKIPLISDYGGDITTPILSEDHGSMTTKSSRHPFGNTMSLFSSPRHTLGTSQLNPFSGGIVSSPTTNVMIKRRKA